MSWFAIDTDLEEHPKFHAFITRRKWSAATGLVFLYRFWRTVRRYAQTGDVTLWTDRYVAAQTGVTRGVSGLLEDLIETGFVDLMESSGSDAPTVRIVHGWRDRNGKWIKDTRWAYGFAQPEPIYKENDLAGNVLQSKADRPPEKGGPSASSRVRARAQPLSSSSTEKDKDSIGGDLVLPTPERGEPEPPPTTTMPPEPIPPPAWRKPRAGLEPAATTDRSHMTETRKATDQPHSMTPISSVIESVLPRPKP